MILTCVLEAMPAKLDIKRCEHGILFISLQHESLFKTSDYDGIIEFRIDSMALTTTFKSPYLFVRPCICATVYHTD